MERHSEGKYNLLIKNMVGNRIDVSPLTIVLLLRQLGCRRGLTARHSCCAWPSADLIRNIELTSKFQRLARPIEPGELFSFMNSCNSAPKFPNKKNFTREPEAASCPWCHAAALVSFPDEHLCCVVCTQDHKSGVDRRSVIKFNVRLLLFTTPFSTCRSACHVVTGSALP